MIASQYGWTFGEFKKLTLRRLHSAMEMIEIRTHNDFAKQASLKGIKLELKRVKRQLEETSEEQKKMMAEVIKRAAQRKVEEKSRRKK